MVQSADSMSMKVELYISGRKLKDLDAFSKSDPQCLVYEMVGVNWVQKGRTEQIKNNLNPEFKTQIVMNYFFEKAQKLKFVMIDGDGGSDYDTIGELETTMGTIMGARAQMLTQDLHFKGQANRGQIIIRAEAVKESNETAYFQLNWNNVNNVQAGCMGMCPQTLDVVLRISRGTSNGQFVKVWESERFQQNRNPKVPQLKMTLTQLCNANKGGEIRFSVHQAGPMAQEINHVRATVDQILQGPNKRFQMNAAAGASLEILNFEIRVLPTFIDYLRSGWAISMVAAIDYTGSNGTPSSPTSLHYLGPNNQYENALNWVGSIIEPYDADRNFPVFGFGGIPNHIPGLAGQTSHCFAINGNPANPEIFGIQNIVLTYRQTQQSIILSGPTLFAPLLQQFHNYVNGMREVTQYNILLLLTDGIINDMNETKNLIVQLSALPCSIIIVGVGNADFSQMEELDGDGGVLRDGYGRPAQRDIVQFVRFNECVARGNLAEEVLKEIPPQLCSHMEKIGFVPKAVAQNISLQ